jgi:uncharacterized protein YwgA
MQSFGDRLLFQKRIYILQELFDIPIGYEFGWYIRGPYSSELTRDGFENESISSLFNRRWDELSALLPAIEEEDSQALVEAQGFFSRVRQSRIEEGRFLELLTSLHFMKVNWYPHEDWQRAVDTLRRLKPHFTQSETEEACRLLQENLEE